MVDVLATDSQGRAVTDLTAGDFEIKENGKVQSIDSFKRFTIDRDPAWVSALPYHVPGYATTGGRRDDVRLIAVFFDDYTTRVGHAMAARERLARFITELGSARHRSGDVPLHAGERGRIFQEDHQRHGPRSEELRGPAS